MKILSLLLSCALVAAFSASPALAQNKTKVKRIDVPLANGEICLGSTMVPKATFSNVSNEAVHIKAQLHIVNSVTGTSIFSTTINLPNVAAGKDTTVSFGNFTTNANTLAHVGRHNVIAIGSAMNSSNVIIGDALPADDTMRAVVFGLRRTALPFRDVSNSYGVVSEIAIPSPHHWVTRGATVVEGDNATFDPPNPRDPATGYGVQKLHSPVIKLDRLNHAGVLYTGTASGDTLSSFAINLQGVTKSTLSFDYHRSSKRQYGWKYDFDTLHGSESTIRNAFEGVARKGDSLILEFKKPNESACDPSANGWTQIAAIDGGKDFEFQRFRVQIESKNNASLNYFTQDFRFRLRLKAKADLATTSTATAIDDEDPWYIDNVHLATPEFPEIAVKWVRVVSPYTKVPASQANFPVYVRLASNGISSGQSAIPVVVQILGPDGKTKYYQRQDVRFISPWKDSIVRFPNWDATNTMITNDRECKVNAWIAAPGYDSVEDDNRAYSSFYLPVESSASLTHEFAYDDGGLLPGPHDGNDYPALTGVQGKGVGFNNTSGSFAVRFNLHRKDTLYGVRVYFARGNASNDEIKISAHEGSLETSVPGALVSNDATFQSQRKGEFFDQFWPYYFPKPIVLHGLTDSTDGVYWLAVSQLSLDNMAMGADISRHGADMRVQDVAARYLYLHRSRYATQYAPNLNAGDITNVVAFEQTAGSGNWNSFDPEYGMALNSGFAQTGSFIPMIRPLLSRRTLLPIEFAKQLEAEDHGNAAHLTWTTATETNNHGFVVQRLVTDDEWQRVGYVASRSTNSNTPNGYLYVDEGLSAGTHTYRLTQVDLDGTESISNTAEVLITDHASHGSSFSPNPFNINAGVTTLKLDPSLGEINVSVVNALGQTVRTITATGNIAWDGKDDTGNLVASGSYLIRLQGATFNEVRRISVAK